MRVRAFPGGTAQNMSILLNPSQMAKCHEDLCLGWYSQPRQSCFRDLFGNCYIPDASLWMREGILRQGVSSAGTRQWTSTATGEVKSSIQHQVETTGSDPTVHLTYSLVKSGQDSSQSSMG